MDEKDAVRLRMVCLERKLWALLLRVAEKRDLDMVREILVLIEVVKRI